MIFGLDNSGVLNLGVSPFAMEDKKKLIALMDELKENGHDLFVVSDSAYKPLPPQLLGVPKDYFSGVVEGAAKSREASWPKILEELKANAKDFIMIDDDEDNLKKAARSNIVGVQYKGADDLRETLAQRGLVKPA